MLSSSGGGMSVLIHSNVAMEGFVSMRRYKGDEEEEEDHVVGKHHQQQVEENGNGSESSSFGVEEESSLSLSSSSLGADEDEAQSELREEDEEDVQDDALASLEDLEDSLPVKRGLSNHFNGKAKSFSSLADVITNPTAAADLAKREHPFNKRRRILMAAKKRRDSWPRRGSCGSLDTLPHPPLIVASELRVLEEVDEEDDGSGRGGGGDSPRLPPLPVMRGRGLKSFRSPRCFSLTNLQQHDEFS